jgi:hypothetical protein
MAAQSKLHSVKGNFKNKRRSERCDTDSPAREKGRRAIGKLARMLVVFAGGEGLNTFQAKEVGDTCLHTTICDLQNQYCITFSREWEYVANRFGTYSRVLRYWLEGASLQKAQALIGEEVPHE